MKSYPTFCSFLIVLFYILCNILASNGIDFNIGGILDNIDKVAGSILDMLTDLDNCAFECPHGQKPIPRAGHKPSANGCGSHEFMLDTFLLPQMTACCNKHDKCYDTCNADKNSCDEDFRDCLNKMCSKLMEGLSDEEDNGCSIVVDVMYAATVALGCKPYRAAQKDACLCATDASTKWKKGNKEYAKRKKTMYNDEL